MRDIIVVKLGPFRKAIKHILNKLEKMKLNTLDCYVDSGLSNHLLAMIVKFYKFEIRERSLLLEILTLMRFLGLFLKILLHTIKLNNFFLTLFMNLDLLSA